MHPVADDVQHGSDGLDEMTTTAPSFVAEIRDGKLNSFAVTPEEAGLDRAEPEALKGSDPESNATAMRAVLDGQPGPYRDVVLFNAAAALIVADKADDLKQGVTVAAEAIDSGRAAAALDAMIAISNSAEGGG